MQGLSQHIKQYQVREKPVSKINNSRQYWISEFAKKIEEQKKLENLYRFWKWKGKTINPKFIKKEELEAFKKEKLPKDKMYLHPWKDSRYAIKLGHVPTEQLQAFFDDCMRCDDSKSGYNFTVCFFHKLKVNKE